MPNCKIKLFGLQQKKTSTYPKLKHGILAISIHVLTCKIIRGSDIKALIFYLFVMTDEFCLFM